MSYYLNQVKQAIQTGSREVRQLATDVGNEVKKTADNNKVNSPLPADVASEIQKAAKILASFTDPNTSEGGLDNVIPPDVIKNAKGLAVFTVVKAGFVWSGRVGSGLVVARLGDGSWSAPSSINIGGVGFGMQAGADVTDFVIVLNTADAVKAFSRGENLTLGGNLSVSAGPVGMGGEVSGSVAERAALWSYSKSKGLFAGISVEGTGIIERKDANKKFYGKEVTATQILLGEVAAPPLDVTVLYDVIKRAESRKVESGETEPKTSS